MSFSDWIDEKAKTYGIARNLNHLSSMFEMREFFMGLPVIYSKYSAEVIFFRACEYCGENRLDDNNCCMTCSAPVEM
jgi:hypothetical protein